MKIVVFFLFFIYLFESLLSAENIKNKADDTNYAIVFTYHRFGETRYPSTNIRLEQFKYQLNYLKDNHYNVWPLSKIVNYMRENRPIPPKTVAICMDDAYKSVYTKAYPLLKQKDFPFTVFVNTMPVIHKSKRYMSWDEMREMGKHGASFANHTYSHDYLTQKKSENKEQWKKRATAEIEKAEEKLRKELGDALCETPKMLAYPFGEYSVQTEALIKELEYAGISQLSGPFGQDTDLTRVPRFPMSETYATPKGFLLKLNTVPLPIVYEEPVDTMLNGKNPPKLRIKLKEPIKNLQCYKSDGDKIKMQWIDDKEVVIQSKTRLKLPRDHYTCTAKADDNKWYWYSHLWVFRQR
ncbi:polysaccharide deacetylase family protein [Sulfurimonas sp. HSL-1716]|uniref:polysaccharide deacetylase family protein n=1 Tax=Hydrocurvibacter sulfurireducens TaxID=3131937 RepID=UPI0031F869E8